MLSVINKDKIESMINQFYESAGLKDTHNPLRVTKLSVSSEYGISVGGGTYDEDFIDEDCAYDYELGMVFDCHLTDTFYIKPANAFISDNPDIGIALEWIPNKAIYVTSKADYIALYKSFVKYLETTQDICKSKHGFKFSQLDLWLCFVNLYDTPGIKKLASLSNTHINVLFTEEIFKPKSTNIRTLNAIFQYMQLG